jgi:hypothetical protein
MKLRPLTVLSLGVIFACTDKDGDEDTGDSATESDTNTPADLAIIGAYTDSYGGAHTITNDTWTQAYGTYHITQFDNADRYVIAENDAANGYAAGLWSRFDWFVDGDSGLWYCQTSYDAATEDDALGTPRADDSDIATTGCGGTFPWSSLTP